MTETERIHPVVRQRRERDRFREVNRCWQEVNAAVESGDTRSQAYVDALLCLAGAYQFNRQFDLAEPLLQEAMMVHVDSGNDSSPHAMRTIAKMVAFYRSWNREDQARPLAARLAELERESYGEVVLEEPEPDDGQERLADTIVETFGGAATSSTRKQTVLGVVVPLLLGALGVVQCFSKTVRIRAYRDFAGPTYTVQSLPAAMAKGVFLFSIALGMHAHFKLGVKHPVLAGYLKFGACIAAILTCFVYAWALWVAR